MGRFIKHFWSGPSIFISSCSFRIPIISSGCDGFVISHFSCNRNRSLTASEISDAGPTTDYVSQVDGKHTTVCRTALISHEAWVRKAHRNTFVLGTQSSDRRYCSPIDGHSISFIVGIVNIPCCLFVGIAIVSKREHDAKLIQYMAPPSGNLMITVTAWME